MCIWDRVSLDLLANKQIGIRRVVNNKKKIEIPSIPKVKFILDWDNQTISSTNWSLGVESSKRTHKNKETKNVKKDTEFPTKRIKKYWCLGINKMKKDPAKRIPTKNLIMIIKKYWQCFFSLLRNKKGFFILRRYLDLLRSKSCSYKQANNSIIN
mgnify:CR=1 FL=1